MNAHAALPAALLCLSLLPPATAGPGGDHAVSATCRYGNGVLAGVAVATGHPVVLQTTITCTVGVGPAGTSVSQTLPGNVAAFVEPLTGAPGIPCAYAEAVWSDGHVATYAQPCPV